MTERIDLSASILATRQLRRDATRRFSAALLAAVTIAVLAAYGGVLTNGRWQGDDYVMAWFVAWEGWHFPLARIVSSSPRPIAELLTYIYMSVSNALDRPGAAWFLGSIWLASIVGIALAGRIARVHQPVLLAMVLFALALLLIKPGDMFYWPQGAAAYVPCWTGLAAATVLHSGRDRHPIALALALLTSVLSVEVGAITVVFYAGLVSVACLLARRLDGMKPVILPALCGVTVCLTVLHGRMQPMSEVMDAASGLAGNWLGSLRAALPVFWRETVAIEGLPLVLGAAGKLLLILCLPGISGQPRERSRLALLWACALLSGAFASIVLSFHEFGTLCCERHATLRQGMLLLALVSVAGLLGPILLLTRQIMLSALLVVLLAIRGEALAVEWKSRTDIIVARAANWASGESSGDKMTLLLVPEGPITNADALPVGQFHRTSEFPFGDTPWFAWGVMARFGKHNLLIAPFTH